MTFPIQTAGGASDTGACRRRPAKIVVEPTTFCQLRCEMCVKQAVDAGIEDGEMSRQTFQRLEPALAGAESLVFSGIGEPLLHKDLEELISLAREQMPKKGRIGIQSNGCLLKGSRIASLIDAGLDVICISVDAATPESFSKIRSGGKIEDIESTVDVLRRHSAAKHRPTLQWGIEFVLMKQNFRDLPAVVRWAADSGASFAIVTHVVPYGQATESECVYSPNTRTSLEFYRRWKEKAASGGLDLDRYLKQRWKYHWKAGKTPAEKALADFGRQMLNEAYEQHIPLHLFNLMDENVAEQKRIRKLFAETRAIAADRELTLTLPELAPKLQRTCHFVEDGSIFVSWKGDVFPCYFLWHDYAFYQNGRKVRVTAKAFGNLAQQSPLEIWNSDAFRSFRSKVIRYDYPFCENCNLGPCNLFTEKAFEFDCYAKDIPCGTCPWCGGLLHCLQ